MRPLLWRPSIGLSVKEEQVVKRIKKAMLFVFLRQHRHLLFDEAFQQELAQMHQASGRQSTLKQDLHLFFADPAVDGRDWRSAETLDAGHGRIEQRALIASHGLNDFLASTWPGVGQVFRLRCRLHHPLKCTQQIVNGFTSLTKEEASPQRLLELIRGHWAIENKLHSRRDVTLREDACQVRKGQAPRVLALLNSFVLALFDWLGVANVASQMRVFAAQPFLALRLLTAPLEKIK